MSGAAPLPAAAAARDLLRETLAFAWDDMRATHTWRTYVFAWSSRLLLQVLFFALVAGFVGDASAFRYALVGNALVLGTLEAMIIVAMMVQERMSGTLPLLAIAPTSHVPVYLGRGLHWLVSAFVSSTVALSLLPVLTGVQLPWPQTLWALPVVALTCLSSYCFGCVLASVALRHVGLTWVILNLGYLPIMAFCGVNVPTSFWPLPVQMVANVLPLTHGLQAVRGVLDGAPASVVLAQVALEALVGCAWLLVSIRSIAAVVRRGVADGSLEHGT